MEELTVNRSEALRYLGYDGQELDGATAALLDECAAETLALARPRTVWRSFELERTAETLALRGASFALEGADIRAHLSGCDECVLMAATLGPDVERRIASLEVRDMARATTLDGCATALIETVCDRLQSELAERMREKGKYLTSRFSPGYGDMPIDCQRAFVSLLDAQRRIGLTATSTNILTPRKSVTAVIGISDWERSGARRGCDTCRLRESCRFRQKGEHCGKESVSCGPTAVS